MQTPANFLQFYASKPTTHNPIAYPTSILVQTRENFMDLMPIRIWTFLATFEYPLSFLPYIQILCVLSYHNDDLTS